MAGQPGVNGQARLLRGRWPTAFAPFPGAVGPWAGHLAGESL